MTPKERWPAVLDREKFSFRYGGRSSDEFLVKWQQTRSVETTPGGKIEHIAYAEAGGGLNVLAHVRRLDDFPAVDWVVEFENRGPEPTPILEDILALDAAVAIPAAERVRLHHAKGSSCRIDDFLPQTDSIAPGGDMLLAPAGGRSSNGVLPFMNIQRDGGGMVLAVGWSGQWMARLNRDEKALHLSAGMERVQLTLHPGEKIRTPRVLILHWEGDDEEQGNNLLRRLLIAHYLPRIDGRLVMPPLAQCLQGYFYASGQANEQLELTALPKVAALGADTYWIDACWYGKGREWWQEVGTWTVNPDRFPRGLKPISNAAHEAGMKFILWFEPERVQRETAIEREHPEFLLRCEDNPDNALLNLGMPEARAYITDAISDIISESGVDIYRQDFNFDPLPYWQAADAPDRIGMTEIRHVEGLYELWDELRRRHPGLWIDNCSSGGRRIDLETLSRSLPLWPSDFPDICGLPYGRGMQVGDQCINAGLSRWIPLFGGGVWNFTPYVTRGQIVGGFTFGMHIPVEDFPPDDDPENSDQQAIAARGVTVHAEEFPFEDARLAIAECKSLQPLILGDFHLLMPLTVSYHDWCACQFHRDDMAAGFALFFRRHRSPFTTMEVQLKRIDPDGHYDVSLAEGYDEPPRQRMTGRELATMNIVIQDKPGSVLLRYSQVTKQQGLST